jgi:trk system potassium uptake protein TrkH
MEIKYRKNRYLLLFYLINLLYFLIYFIFYKISTLKELIFYLNIFDILYFTFFLILDLERYFYIKENFKDYDFLNRIKSFIYGNYLIYLLIFVFTVFFRYFINWSFQYSQIKNNLIFYDFVLILKQIFLVILFLIIRNKYKKYFKYLKLKTDQIIVIGFILVIFLGGVLLFQKFSINTKDISFLDALFMSTSAVCVTGLSVKSVAYDFNLIGKIVFLFLMQIGGLGIMFLYAAILNLVPSKFSLKSYFYTKEAFDVSIHKVSVESIFRFIFIYTFFIEFIGVVLFFMRFFFIYKDIMLSLKFAIFHSISAFCNAGLSLFPNSFENFKGDIYLNLILIFLITMGGIGFYTGYDIYRVAMNRLNLRYGKKYKNKIYLTSQSKMVIYIYLILNILGFFSFYLLERDNSLVNLSLKEKILVSILHPVSARTAGFNSINLSLLKPSTLLILCVLMFIGTASGSTGGGIKVSTFGVIILTFLSYIKNNDIIKFGKYRRIRNITIRKAFSLFFLQISLIFFWIIILTNLEKFKEINIIFEVFSAFGTVGLSTGITFKLSDISKIFIIVAMFIGRISPLTLASAISREKEKIPVYYPPADISIG